MRKLARGRQGSWFAKMLCGPCEGQSFPCVRREFISRWPNYLDPIAGKPLPQQYIDAVLGEGRVILIDFKADQRFYIALWEIENAVMNEYGLAFRFSTKIE